MRTSFVLTIMLALAGCSKEPASPSSATSTQSATTKPTGPLRCALSIKKPVVAQNEPIKYAVEIKNVSDKLLSFEISRDGGCLHIISEDGKDMRYSGPAYTHTSMPVSLKSGEVHVLTSEEWPQNYNLAPGHYRAFFLEEEHQADRSPITIQTPPVPFTVTAASR